MYWKLGSVKCGGKNRDKGGNVGSEDDCGW